MNKLPVKLEYEAAGVSIPRGNELVRRIKGLVNSTNRPGVMSSIGGFGALFDLSAVACKNPVLVAGTDGVGTKLKLAIETRRHDTIGIDLVAMCVNDLLVQGVIKGIVAGCRMAGCALVGGETAEMPGMYQTDDYDLAGFCVGIVDREKIIDGSTISADDTAICLASSGAHSNGYSLIRKILSTTSANLDGLLDGRRLIVVLLEPTRIYVKPVRQLLEQIPVKGIAHITGGGLTENIPRVLPDAVQINIDTHSWQWPALFTWLQQQGNIDTPEMYTTFNCGIGLVLVVDSANSRTAIDTLNALGETAWELGTISKREKADTPVIFC